MAGVVGVHANGAGHGVDAFLELQRGEVGRIVLAGPFLQHVIGGAEGPGPVHGSAAAEAGAGQDADAAVLGAEGALGIVERAEHVDFALGEVAAVAVGAFFEHQYVVASLGQLAGYHAAARAGTNHQYVALVHCVGRWV